MPRCVRWLSRCLLLSDALCFRPALHERRCCEPFLRELWQTCGQSALWRDDWSRDGALSDGIQLIWRGAVCAGHPAPPPLRRQRRKHSKPMHKPKSEKMSSSRDPLSKRSVEPFVSLAETYCLPSQSAIPGKALPINLIHSFLNKMANLEQKKPLTYSGNERLREVHRSYLSLRTRLAPQLRLSTAQIWAHRLAGATKKTRHLLSYIELYSLLGQYHIEHFLQQ